MAAPAAQAKIPLTAGQNDNLTWVIKIERENPLNATATVTDQIGQHKIPKQDVIWNNPQGVDKDTLLKWAVNEKSRFQVDFEVDKGSEGYIVHITITTEAGKPAPKKAEELPVQMILPQVPKPHEEQPLTIFSMENASDLAILLRKNQDCSDLRGILREIVCKFCNESSISKTYVNEIVEIAEFLDRDQRKNVIEQIFLKIGESLFFIDIVKGLTKILTIFQEVNYKNSLIYGTDAIRKFIANPLYTLDATSIVDLMKLIEDKLKKLQKSDDVIVIHLKALNALLDVMCCLHLTDVSRKEHERFRKIVHDYSNNDNWNIAFLGAYGEQSLTSKVWSDESGEKESLRRGLHVLKGLAIIGDHISLIEPWHIVGAFEAGSELKKAWDGLLCSWQKDWFDQLTFFQQYLLGKNPAALVKFAQAVKEEREEFKNNFPLSHNAHFVQGLIFLMKQMTKTFVFDHPEIALAAISVLEKIVRNNHEGAPTALFRVKGHGKKFIHQITDFLRKIADKKKAYRSVAEAARVSYNTIDLLRHPPRGTHDTPQNLREAIDIEFESAMRKSGNFFPVKVEEGGETLFQKAMKVEAPWISKTIEFRNELKRDVIADLRYVVPTKVKGAQPENPDAQMDTLLTKILSDKNSKVILLKGAPGSGKSLFSKRYVLDRLKTYDLRDPLVLYIELNKITDFRSHLMQEALEQLKMVKEESFLQSKDLCLICDGFDELYLNGKNPGEALDNLYVANGLEKKWPNVRLVITCRTEFLTPGVDDIYFWTDKPLEQISLASKPSAVVAEFSKDDIRNFVHQYIRERRAEPQPPDLLEAKEYFSYFDKLGLWEVMSKPYNLKNALLHLRDIVNRKPIADNSPDKEVILQKMLLDILISKRCVLEVQRTLTRSSAFKKIDEYFNFVLDLTRCMKTCNLSSLSEKNLNQLKEKQKKNILGYESEIRTMKKAHDKKKKEEKKEEKPRVDQLIQKLEEEITRAKNIVQATDKILPLIKDGKYESCRRVFLSLNKQGIYEFEHPLIYEHFRTMDEKPEDKARFRQCLEETLNISIYGALPSQQARASQPNSPRIS